MQDEFAGDQRHGGKRQAGRDRDERDAPPVDEGAPAFGQPSRHSWISARTRALSKSRPGPSRLHPAEVEKIEMVGERKRLLDVLLDQQDRDPARLPARRAGCRRPARPDWARVRRSARRPAAAAARSSSRARPRACGPGRRKVRRRGRAACRRAPEMSRRRARAGAAAGRVSRRNTHAPMRRFSSTVSSREAVDVLRDVADAGGLEIARAQPRGRPRRGT